MGEETSIAWADASWNPVIGCKKVSPACTNCYAETYAKNRLKRPELWRGERHITSVSTWNLPERLDRKAAKEGRRLHLFVASLSDVFEDHPAWLTPMGPEYHRVRGVDTIPARLLALRKLRELHHVDVLLLTKRPENVLRMVPPEWLDAWPAHIWVGTTVEDQPRADERLDHLCRVPAAVRFVSYEPALGPVNFAAWLFTQPPAGIPDEPAEAGGMWRGPDPLGSAGLQWIITGGESGDRRARAAHPQWYRTVRDQCARAGVPFLHKQNGEWLAVSQMSEDETRALYRSKKRAEQGQDQDELDEVYGRTCTVEQAVVHLDGSMHGIADQGAYQQGAGPMLVFRVGTKASGRKLDGVEHHAFPVPS